MAEQEMLKIEVIEPDLEAFKHRYIKSGASVFGSHGIQVRYNVLPLKSLRLLKCTDLHGFA